ASAEEPARPVRFEDDFRTDTRKDYQIKGEVTWQKGRLTLAKGALLHRPLELGSVAEVRAVVRWARGQQEGGLVLGLIGGGQQAAGAALVLSAGKPSLVLLASPRQVLPLARAATEASWVVRLELNHGLARARAWPQGTTEPRDWQLLRPA